MIKLQYPHIWPPGKPRILDREPTVTRISLARAADDLIHELALLDATEVIISCDVQPLTGYIGYPEQYPPPLDPSVAVSFTLRGGEYVLACGAWDSVAGNMRDIGRTIAQKRSLCHNRSVTVEQEFLAYRLQPLPPIVNPVRHKPWWQVLHVSPDAPITVIEGAYRGLSKQYHPDLGGDSDAMAELNRAIAEAKAARPHAHPDLNRL